MKKLSEYQNEKLQVVQLSFFKRIFELRCDSELLSTLSYPKFFSRTAVTEGNLTCSFEFYFPSFWKSEIEIRPKDYEQPVAKYTGKVFSLTEIIELPKGEKVLLKSFAFRQKKEIQSENGETLLAFNYAISFKFRIDIEIVKKTELIDKYPWLIMLVIYIGDQHKKSKS
ncbi:MAG: hypothetical protein CO129_05880 [Ignavibacteriales bacterium CG_4_9_14_3_um_filter_34_10]|nr:MAG: hypothetical protein CO129_05880 [Ignavibacteriales bacterium CG_4_9_14_3_um_filter_34_10]